MMKKKLHEKETRRRTDRGENRAARSIKEKRENEKIRLNTVIRVLCLVVLLIVTRVGIAADELTEEAVTEKKVIVIVLRPEKMEGEPDPDLSDAVLAQIREQAGEDDPALLDRLCACVSWTYEYNDEVTPPGENRKPGESDIYLMFEEDPDYVFSQAAVYESVQEEYCEFYESAEPEYYEEMAEPESIFEPEIPDTFEEPEPHTDEESEWEFFYEPEEYYYETAEENVYVENPEQTEEAAAEYSEREEEAAAEYPEKTEETAAEYPAETEETAAEYREEWRSFLTTRPREEEPAEEKPTEEEPDGNEDNSGAEPAIEQGIEDTKTEENLISTETEENLISAEAEENMISAEIGESVTISETEDHTMPANEEEEFFEVNTAEAVSPSEEEKAADVEHTIPESASEGTGILSETNDGSAGGSGTDPGGAVPEPAVVTQRSSSKTYYVPQEVADSVAELMQDFDQDTDPGSKTAETSGTGQELAASEIKAGRQVQLLRTDSSNTETDLTEMYRGALADKDPGRLDWETLLAPLPVNDGTYILRTTETDNSGKDTVTETAFSVNRFGSVYTYNKAIQSLRGKVVKEVSSPLVISEYNPDMLEPDSWNLELTLDSKPVGRILYSVIQKESREDAPKEKAETGAPMKKWNCYDYVISADNFREDGIYRLSVSSRDTSGNTSEMNRYNGGEIIFTVDGTPPELQAIQGLEKSVVNGRKAEVKVTAFDTVGLARVAAFVDGKCMAAENMFSDRHRAELSFSIPKGEAQKVRIVAEDTAGNILDTDEKTAGDTYAFRPAFPFSRNITVKPDVLTEHPEQHGTGFMILILMVIVCSGASGGLLWYTFRKDKTGMKEPVWDSD